MNFNGYEPGDFYDELFTRDGAPRASCRPLVDQINKLVPKGLGRRQRAAEAALLQMGITFSVYGDRDGTEKIFPFDLIPRIIESDEWDKVAKGLEQRIRALNLFIDDVYNDQKILKDKVVPFDLVESAATFLKPCKGLRPPKGIWIHITGSDLIRDHDGTFYVLEDNLRCPSGVSYLLENRAVLKRTFPAAFKSMSVRLVNNYCDQLLETLRFISPTDSSKPKVVVMTPGVYNSAYFEHAYLAQQMGVELVEGRDLVVNDGAVCMRTTKGLEKIDVIYRRIDDEYLDPKVFNSDSMLGVPGLMEVYLNGGVGLANAPGTASLMTKPFTPILQKLLNTI